VATPPGLGAAERREQQRLQPSVGDRCRQRHTSPAAPTRSDELKRTVLRATPIATAIARSDAPNSYFTRRISRTRHIATLSAGIGPPLALTRRQTVPLLSDRATTPPQGLPTTDRNGRYDLGMPSRLVPEYAIYEIPVGATLPVHQLPFPATDTCSPERSVSPIPRPAGMLSTTPGISSPNHRALAPRPEHWQRADPTGGDRSGRKGAGEHDLTKVDRRSRERIRSGAPRPWANDGVTA
jgi:hypothetical protein